MVSEVQNSKLLELSVFLNTWYLLSILVSHEQEINIKAERKNITMDLMAISLKNHSNELDNSMYDRPCLTSSGKMYHIQCERFLPAQISEYAVSQAADCASRKRFRLYSIVVIISFYV